ncbi:hypothetical protein RYX36_023353, partial [Vicia faba]
SRLLRYDLPSSSYRSYSRFIPIRCYDVPYSNSGDSRRSIALFTSEWYYWTDPLIMKPFHYYQPKEIRPLLDIRFMPE